MLILWFLSYVFSLLSHFVGPYLIIATGKKHVGKIDGCDIFLITEFDMLAFSRSNIHLSQEQV